MPYSQTVAGMNVSEEYLIPSQRAKAATIQNGNVNDAFNFAESKPSPSRKNRNGHVKGEING